MDNRELPSQPVSPQSIFTASKSSSNGSNDADVLIVDDDSAFLEIMKVLLHRRGFRTESTTDSSKALELTREKKFPVVIADLNMPGNQQLEFIRSVASGEDGPSIIIVSGFPTLDSALSSFDLPVVAYLRKPFEGEELVSHVRASIIRSQLRKTIVRSRERIVEWMNSLNSLDELLNIRPQSCAAGVPIDIYITLTVHNILEPLFDLKHLTETLTKGTTVDKENVCNLFKCPRLEQQKSLLDHSVEILEKTKQSFKSKELGELRKKLEKFLQVSAQ
jgi:DNA-binding response OmpR family regulator